MATAATLVQRTRRFLRDWPEGDVLTASLSSSTTSVTVADATIYVPGSLIQVDTEAMQVRSGVSTTVTVFRGARGSTAATHSNGATVLVRPRFLDVDYLDALNAGIAASFPLIYMPHAAEYSGVDSTTYEYDIPTMTDGTVIPYISKLQFKYSGDTAYHDFRSWNVVRGATPFIKLRAPLDSGGTLRIIGFGAVPQLSSLSDTLSTYYPARAEDALVMFAAQYLLAAGENARVREDTGARDQRENANRPGSSMNAANAIYTRFQRRLMDAAMPPMPKNVVSVL